MRFTLSFQRSVKAKGIQKNLSLPFIKDKKAFSLVEILVAMVIMVAVFFVGLLIFSQISLRISKQSAEKIITGQASDFTLFLRHKLKEAIINDIEGPFRMDFTGTETSIKFIAPYIAGKGSDIGKYSIYFDGSEIKMAFERIDRNTKSYELDSGFSGSQTFVQNVKKLSFSYWNGQNWQNHWNTKENPVLPDKIKIYFVLRGGISEGKEIEKAFEEEIWMGK